MPKPIFDVAKCIYCKCTDDWACEGGCSWHAVDYRSGKGVCSNCVDRHKKALKRSRARKASRK